jgi:hypothetical protein
MLIMLAKSVFPLGHQRLRLGGELGSAGLPGAHSKILASYAPANAV